MPKIRLTSKASRRGNTAQAPSFFRFLSLTAIPVAHWTDAKAWKRRFKPGGGAIKTRHRIDTVAPVCSYFRVKLFALALLTVFAFSSCTTLANRRSLYHQNKADGPWTKKLEKM
jgi:hypothetical protein